MESYGNFSIWCRAVIIGIVISCVCATESASSYENSLERNQQERDNWYTLQLENRTVHHIEDFADSSDEQSEKQSEITASWEREDSNESHENIPTEGNGSDSDEAEATSLSPSPILQPTVEQHSLGQYYPSYNQEEFTTEHNTPGYTDKDDDSSVSETPIVASISACPPQTCLYIPNEVKNREESCEKGERGQRGRRGYPGDPGRPGLAGRPGLSIEGQKGQKGEPCLFDYASWKAENTEILQENHIDTSIKPEAVNLEDKFKRAPYEIVPGAIVFKNRESMIHMTEFSHIGTVIFIKDEETFFGRVGNGWREIKDSFCSICPFCPFRPFCPGGRTKCKKDGQNRTLGVMFGDVITLPFQDSKDYKDYDGTKKAKELDWLSRRRRTWNNRKNKLSKPHIRMAALNNPWNGDLHGVHGADHKCSKEAQKANITGNFRAFISQMAGSIKNIVKLPYRNLPVLNLRGNLLFRSWNEIFENFGKFPRNLRLFSFNGRDVLSHSHWPVKRIWHGVTLSNEVGKSSNCKLWNSDRFYNEGLASEPLQRGNSLLSQQKLSCRQSLIVLCIETASAEK